MATAEINPGICGLNSVVKTEMKGDKCIVRIESECKGIRNLAEKISEVEPLQEIRFGENGSRVINLASTYCYHTACPVPAGIIKAIEIAAGLALPKEVHIVLSK